MEEPWLMAGAGASAANPAAEVLRALKVEVQADCVCIVHPGACYRGRRRRCKLTVFV